MFTFMKSLSLVGMALLMVALVACGSAAEEGQFSAQTADAPAAMQKIGVEVQPAALAPTAVPEAAQLVSEEPVDSLLAEGILMSDSQVARAAQNRVIVRTVDMLLVVSNVAQSVDRVAAVAQELGGWVVNADRSSNHSGFVSIRVPAQQLDQAVLRLRQSAIDVEYETSTSEDVTAQFVDNEARLRSMEATEKSLLELMGRSGSVKDTLEVQRSLAELQAEIETVKGRLRFLRETAAYSLVNVNLRLASVEMPVNAGADQTLSVGQAARFRATFEPPPGIEEFRFLWDFGDGSPPVSGTASAPSPGGSGRVTATVNHTYNDDRDSPFIVQFEMSGSGDAGRAEGSDTLIATVTKIPSIEVFAGEDRETEAGREVEYAGSFTRPPGLENIQYRWDFGDGSPPLAGVPEEGVTRAVATHAYADHRIRPYTVTLTVSADSQAGQVEGSSSFTVQVAEARGLIIGGWSAGATGKTAIRALSVVAQGLGTIIIWLAIFSPVWLIGGGIIYVIARVRRQRRHLGARDSFYRGLGERNDDETTEEGTGEER